MVSGGCFISKRALKGSRTGLHPAEDHAPGRTVQRGTWREPATWRHARCRARLEPFWEYGAQKLGPNLTQRSVGSWVFDIFSQLLGQEE